jgi:hypothetical protein
VAAPSDWLRPWMTTAVMIRRAFDTRRQSDAQPIPMSCDTPAGMGSPRAGSVGLVARYNREGEAAFTPRSRRPHTSPARLAQSTIELIIDLRHPAGGQRPRPWAAHHRLATYTTTTA